MTDSLALAFTQAPAVAPPPPASFARRLWRVLLAIVLAWGMIFVGQFASGVVVAFVLAIGTGVSWARAHPGLAMPAAELKSTITASFTPAHAPFWILAALGETFALGLAVIPFSRRRQGGPLRALGWIAPPSWRAVLWQVPAALVAYVIWAVAAGWAMKAFLPSLSQTPSIVGQVEGGLQLLPLMALAIGVLAPIAEESVFRGYLFGRVENSFGAGWAIAVSALAFAAAHFDFAHHSALQPAIVLGMGIVLGLMRSANGGLVPGAIAHATVNCGALAIAALQLKAHGG